MPIDFEAIHGIEFVTDAAGKRIKAILPLEDLQELIIDVAMIEAVEQAKYEPKRPFSEFLDELRANGKIDV